MRTDRIYELRWVNIDNGRERLISLIKFIYIKKHLAFFESLRKDFKPRNINIVPSLISNKIYTIEEDSECIKWRYKYEGFLSNGKHWNMANKNSIFTFIRNRKGKTRS